MKQVVLFVVENTFISTIAGPLEVFAYTGGMWNYLTGSPLDLQFQVTVVSLDGKPIRTRTGLVITPDASLDQAPKADIVLVASCGEDIESAISNNQSAIPWLRQQHESGALLGSICSGLALLAETGLLDGRKAATHWGMRDEFQQRYPLIEIQGDDLFIDDGDIVTSGGGNAGSDLALYLVEKFCSYEISKQCANALLLDTDRGSQKPYSGILHHRIHGDEKVQNIQSWLDQHFHQEINLDDLAEKNHMSPRNFKRRFKVASGESPLGYLQKLRVEAAKKLLESGDSPVDQISLQVGYVDHNHFRKLFKRHTTLTPSSYRERYRRK